MVYIARRLIMTKNRKQTQTSKSKIRPADTFAEKIVPRPPQTLAAPAPHDDLGRPAYHEHDEFGEWLLRETYPDIFSH